MKNNYIIEKGCITMVKKCKKFLETVKFFFENY